MRPSIGGGIYANVSADVHDDPCIHIDAWQLIILSAPCREKHSNLPGDPVPDACCKLSICTYDLIW